MCQYTYQTVCTQSQNNDVQLQRPNNLVIQLNANGLLQRALNTSRRHRNTANLFTNTSLATQQYTELIQGGPITKPQRTPNSEILSPRDQFLKQIYLGSSFT
ncbi:15398_t:CDS:1, partial [Cetraspora pellucida]